MKPKYDYKRRKSGYTRSQMANELNIPYNKYVEIERGDRQMPSRLIDKFNEVINRGKHINKLENLNKDKNVSEWMDEMRKLTSDSKTSYALKDVMKDFNIDSYKELGHLLNVDPSTIGNVLAGRMKGSDLCGRLYDFFHDDLNKQSKSIDIEQLKSKTKARYLSNSNKELLSWWNDFDLQAWLKENKLKQIDFAEMVGLNNSSISKYCTDSNSVPFPKNLETIYNCITAYNNDEIQDLKDKMPELPSENKQEEIVVETQHTNSNNIVIDTIENMIKDYDKKISDEMIYIERMNAEIEKMKLIVNTHNLSINDARSKKESLQEVLSVISNEMKGRD